MSTTINIPVINKSSNELPKYAHKGDAGFDLRANVEEIKNDNYLFNAIKFNATTIILNPGGRVLIPTGLYMAIPEGYELQIRPRSGLALKYGITVVNTPGTIDATYRGNIGVILKNDGTEPFIIEQGDRIAQGVLNKVEEANLIETDYLDETDRSDSGYGKSGVK
jgi:dUTP pyrophosphatase|nr:MAG TPA: dUTPase [Caudoviricetes sp.]